MSRGGRRFCERGDENTGRLWIVFGWIGVIGGVLFFCLTVAGAAYMVIRGYQAGELPLLAALFLAAIAVFAAGDQSVSHGRELRDRERP